MQESIDILTRVSISQEYRLIYHVQYYSLYISTTVYTVLVLYSVSYIIYDVFMEIRPRNINIYRGGITGIDVYNFVQFKLYTSVDCIIGIYRGLGIYTGSGRSKRLVSNDINMQINIEGIAKV